MMTKIAKAVRHPARAMLYFYQKLPTGILPDEAYLKVLYRLALGKKLSLDPPRTFNEKLQWLKLRDRRPEYTVMADKYRVREYIRDTLGEAYLIPLLGVWDDPEEINFDTLPEQFVLKCSHNSGLGMCICRDKSGLDIDRVKKELRRGLRQDYYLTGREWPYKNVPRRIVCEAFLSGSGDVPDDYKIHNFNGKPRMILVCRNRFRGMTEDFFDTEWNHLELSRPCRPHAEQMPEKPPELEKLLALSETLAAGLPFLRTDFYLVNGRIYFGELTFFPAGGLEAFVPAEWDRTLGSWLELPEK